MTKKLTEYAPEELQRAIDLIAIRENNAIKDGDYCFSYHSGGEFISLGDEYDTVSIPTSLIPKLRLFLSCFDENNNWVGVKD
jgi:hypothetical protein